MPAPERKIVTFEIDGREVQAPEGVMLVDGAKYGDVEIPVFCYEPKLGAPVGACRMCLVEIEGIPKLQTACSTAVKDGMVVITTSERVKQAQNAVVEFLLVNHPLDCPVCDKGGECPLQDITFGWGPGRSRFIEPKRHFKKPLALSPLVAIDRERCILCYRCVRFSQEVAEDYQLVFLERGDHTYVGTHDGHPYVAPFSGNIVELCPVGALTSTAYRFRARPWDIEDAGSVCSLCPSQCNVKFTIRDDKVQRVLARDNPEVDDGWLCDKGRFGYQAVHSADRITAPMVRDGGALRPVSWERALSEATSILKRAGERTAAIVGGEATNEEGFLVQRLLREVLGSPHVDSRPGAALDPEHARALARPQLAVSVSDIDWAKAIVVLDTDLVNEAPILDLRVRKAARRHGARVVVVTSHPTTLDANADAVLRIAPGGAEAALAGLAGALGDGDTSDLARRAGTTSDDLEVAAGFLRRADSVVVIWGERLSSGERGPQAVRRLLGLADALGLADTAGSGLIEVPSGTNSRGLREVGCVPNLAPGLADAATAGKGAAEIAAALGDELGAVLLVHADPLRTHPDRAAWTRALDSATGVIAIAGFTDGAVGEFANVVFPADSYAEREGTLTHPDGRLQRVRQTVGHPGEVRPIWAVLLDLMQRLGHEPGLEAAPEVSEAMFGAVPFYEGITLEGIAGHGLRWQELEAASKVPAAELPDGEPDAPPDLPEGLRLGTVPSLWGGPATRHAEALRFLHPVQRAELSRADAERLGIAPGDDVEVRLNGTSVRARAALRDGLPPGSVILLEGIDEDNANALLNGRPRVVEVTKR